MESPMSTLHCVGMGLLSSQKLEFYKDHSFCKNDGLALGYDGNENLKNIKIKRAEFLDSALFFGIVKSIWRNKVFLQRKRSRYTGSFFLHIYLIEYSSTGFESVHTAEPRNDSGGQ